MIKELTESNNEIDKMVDHWSDQVATMSKAELRDAIGLELEHLEYSPAQVNAVLPQILERLPKK